MSPLSLLFSSDEGTSRALAQALAELELAVDPCPEIFSAVEKITGRSYDVVICDCDEGPEAAFLLKTAHELKSNQAAFTIAVSSPNNPVFLDAHAHLLLTKPIQAQQAKYALLTCDEFLAHMKTWLPKLGFPAAEGPSRSWPGSERTSPRQAPVPITASSRARRPSPIPLSTVESHYHAQSSSAAAGALFQGSGVQSLFHPSEKHRSKSFRLRIPQSWLRVTALAVVFLSVGYVFSEPLRSESVASSVAVMCNRALERTQSWFHSSEILPEPSPETSAHKSNPRPVDRYAALAHHSSVANGGTSSKQTAPVQDEQPVLVAQVQPPRPASSATRSNVPESLKIPMHALDPRIVASAIGPSFLAALEPVSLPEELAQKLLLEKVQPSYPEQALRAGMQGPVVLQAFIAKDGSIRELKLVRGSLLLGQAAYQAVKQWRYQPYLLNGKPVEAQTLVTIDFRLP